MKKIINIEIDCNIDVQYGCNISIDEFIDQLKEAKKMGAEMIDLQPVEDYGAAYIELSFYKSRLETDDEFKLRIDRERKQEQYNKDRDFQFFERIRIKYGL